MSGFTKYMFEKDMNEIKKQFSLYVKEISVVLPQEYDICDIVDFIEEYYPYEFRVFREKYEEYCIHDKS